MLVSTFMKTLQQSKIKMYFLFCKTFICHYSCFQKTDASLNKKGKSKIAQCNANIEATIKLDTVSTRKKDSH